MNLQLTQHLPTINELKQYIDFLPPEQIRELDTLLLEYEIEQAKEWTLVEFLKAAWETIEPGTPYIHGWHIDAICDHLTALYNLQIKNLIINMPPRHAKSILCSVAFPVWVWTKDPTAKFMYTSYSADLSRRDSLKCRRLIQSNWFQTRFSDVFSLSKDQKSKTRFDNDSLGYRLATSVKGIGTGEGGDYIIADDANNVKEAESKKVIEATNTYWDESLSSRGNNPKKTRRLNVQQRSAENDLSGHLIEKGGYEILCLPAEYEKTVYSTSIGFKDPRTKDGELLWPDKFGPAEINELKKSMGMYAAAGQLQQRPSPRGGGIIKQEWWPYFDIEYDTYNQDVIISPVFDRIIQSWDTAFKDGEENDYSVCLTAGINSKGVFLIHRFKDKLQYPELLHKVKQLATQFKPSVVLIEDKASGQSLVQSLKRETLLPVKPFKVDKDKISRVNVVSGYIESGRAQIPNNVSWVNDFLYNMSVFPKGTHDDDVDALTMLLNYVFLKEPISLRNMDHMHR